MKLPGNIPSSVFHRHLLLHLNETMPPVITKYWRFEVEHDMHVDAVRVMARYKQWAIAVAIDPVKWGLLSGGLVCVEQALKKHFWFIGECADEDEMYAKLLLAHRPEKVA